jgi:hypothetical protein
MKNVNIFITHLKGKEAKILGISLLSIDFIVTSEHEIDSNV